MKVHSCCFVPDTALVLNNSSIISSSEVLQKVNGLGHTNLLIISSLLLYFQFNISNLCIRPHPFLQGSSLRPLSYQSLLSSPGENATLMRNFLWYLLPSCPQLLVRMIPWSLVASWMYPLFILSCMKAGFPFSVINSSGAERSSWFTLRVVLDWISPHSPARNYKFWVCKKYCSVHKWMTVK